MQKLCSSYNLLVSTHTETNTQRQHSDHLYDKLSQKTYSGDKNIFTDNTFRINSLCDFLVRTCCLCCVFACEVLASERVNVGLCSKCAVRVVQLQSGKVYSSYSF